MPRSSGQIGRFQVMAVLQAARAQRLGLPLASAQSWGLNRAIFIAAAKRGLEPTGRGAKRPDIKDLEEDERKRVRQSFGAFHLGEDKAYKVERDGTILFTIGGDIQTPEAYKKQVQSRFGPAYRQAWKEAQQIIKEAPRTVLESPEDFFIRVYRPRRDTLAARWSKMAKKRD